MRLCAVNWEFIWIKPELVIKEAVKIQAKTFLAGVILFLLSLNEADDDDVLQRASG